MDIPSTTILLIRHGETAWNRSKIFRGTYDIPLNENGRAQAALLQSVLPQIDAAYASPLARARETAQLALKGREMPITVQHGLIDFDYGEWTAKEDEVVKQQWPEEHACWLATPHLAHPPGGDTLRDVSSKAMMTLRNVVEAHRGETVALFAHRVVNKLLVMGMLGLGLERFPFIRQDNCCINEFHAVDDSFIAVRMNDTGHMRDADVLEVDF